MLLKIEIYTDCVYTGNVLIYTDSMWILIKNENRFGSG